MILFRKARRRHPGIYVFRTRKHLRRGTEWGYVGKSNHLALRQACHEGTCTRHPACVDGKPWADLIVSYRAFELPWWLGWQWVTLSLETLVIAALRPRYNWQKNPRRSKVGPRAQAVQRAARQCTPIAVQRSGADLMDLAVRGTAVFLMVAGIVGYLVTSR